MNNNVIIITNSYDGSTDEVINWVHYYNKNIIRFSSEDIINAENIFHFDINKKQFIFRIKSKKDIKNICSVWIRKGAATKIEGLEIIDDEILKKQLSNHLFLEINEAKISFVNALEKNFKTLGTIPGIKCDKISQLIIAKKSGFNIPKTIITNSKSELIKFRNKKLITKCIKDNCFMQFKDAVYGQYTEIITENIIENLPDFFAPSMVQECLDKDYDIRVFYLDSKIYSMAIISVNKNIDFRKDYFDNHIRYIPYKLPSVIQKKIKLFMTNINLNTGSIDIVKTKNNRYFFIEINPSGQFGMLSYPCNYFLEEKIAKYLCEN